MIRKTSFLLVALMALMLAACGGGGNTGGGGNASSTTLSETYDANGISFKYPSGWVVEPAAAEGGPVIIANNQATLDAAKSGGTTSIAAGQQFIIVLPFVGETFQAMSAVVSSPVDLLTQMGPAMSGGESGLTLGTPTEATIGGKPAAKASGSSDSGDAQLIAINVGDQGYMMVMGGAGKGEMGNLDATLNALAESITVTPAS